MDPIKLANDLHAAYQEYAKVHKMADYAGIWSESMPAQNLSSFPSIEAAEKELSWINRNIQELKDELADVADKKPTQRARFEKISASVQAVYNLIGSELSVPAGGKWNSLTIIVDTKSNCVALRGEIFHVDSEAHNRLGDYTIIGRREIINRSLDMNEVIRYAPLIEELAGVEGLSSALTAVMKENFG